MAAPAGLIRWFDEIGFDDIALVGGGKRLTGRALSRARPARRECAQPRRPPAVRIVGSKEYKLVYDVGGGKGVKNVPVSPGDRARFAVDDDEILTLARWACAIEDHYSAKRGLPTPMDMEWAKDGLTGELFVVQARPETVQAHRRRDVLETYRLQETGVVLVHGRSVAVRGTELGVRRRSRTAP